MGGLKLVGDWLKHALELYEHGRTVWDILIPWVPAVMNAAILTGVLAPWAGLQSLSRPHFIALLVIIFAGFLMIINCAVRLWDRIKHNQKDQTVGRPQKEEQAKIKSRAWSRLSYVVIAAALAVSWYYAGINTKAGEGQPSTPQRSESPKEVMAIPFPSNPEILAQEPRLGMPKANVARSIKYAYIEGHNNATAIWIEPLGHIIILRNDKTFGDYEDDINPTVDRNFLNDDATLKQLLPLGFPKGCLPPKGGIAKIWMGNPSERRFIDCREWNCLLDTKTNAIRYEEYTNGYVITGVPNGPNNSQGRTLYLRFIDGVHKNGTWHPVGSSESLPMCEQVSD